MFSCCSAIKFLFGNRILMVWCFSSSQSHKRCLRQSQKWYVISSERKREKEILFLSFLSIDDFLFPFYFLSLFWMTSYGILSFVDNWYIIKNLMSPFHSKQNNLIGKDVGQKVTFRYTLKNKYKYNFYTKHIFEVLLNFRKYLFKC